MRSLRDRTLFAKLIALLMALSLVAAACGTDDDVTDPGVDDDVDAEEGGEIVVAATQEISGWNTNTSADNLLWGGIIVQLIWPNTARVTPDFELDWLVIDGPPVVESEDPFVVTWNIKPEAVWDDGTPVSADDFEYYWLACNGRIDEGQPTVVDEETGEETTGVDCASTVGYELIDSMEKSDDGKSVTATFSDVYVNYEGLFGASALLAPSHVAHASDDPWEFWNTGFKDDPFASAGPFRLDQWNKGDNLILVRNENFWGEPAKLDRIIFRFVDEDAAADALRNREVDVITPQPQIDLVQQVDQFPGVRSSIEAGPTYEHFTYNLRNDFLAMIEVRRAIAFGVDREEIVDALLRPFDPSLVVLGNRIYVTNQPEYVDNTPAEFAERDVDAARAELEGAGFTEGADGIYELNGERLTLRVSTTGGNPRRERAQELLIDQMADVGIEITTYNLPGADVFDRIFSDLDFDIAMFAWVGSIFPENAVGQIFGTGSGSNSGAYSNEEVDALGAQILGTIDADERADLLNQVDQILWEELPMLPLYQLPNFLAWNEEFVNLVNNPTTSDLTWNAEAWGRRAS